MDGVYSLKKKKKRRESQGGTHATFKHSTISQQLLDTSAPRSEKETYRAVQGPIQKRNSLKNAKNGHLSGERSRVLQERSTQATASEGMLLASSSATEEKGQEKIIPHLILKNKGNTHSWIL